MIQLTKPKVRVIGAYVEIPVTQLDIDLSRKLLKNTPFHGDHCPIALAIRAAFPGSEARVDADSMVLYDGISIDLPLEAETFIDDFDNGLSVKPFTFKVPIANFS
jgi:hypothetical protein